MSHVLQYSRMQRVPTSYVLYRWSKSHGFLLCHHCNPELTVVFNVRLGIKSCMKCCMPPWVANLDLQLCVLRSGIAVLAVKGTLDPYMHLHIIVLCLPSLPLDVDCKCKHTCTVVFLMQGRCLPLNHFYTWPTASFECTFLMNYLCTLGLLLCPPLVSRVVPIMQSDWSTCIQTVSWNSLLVLWKSIV